MDEVLGTKSTIRRELRGEPRALDGYIVQPVAELTAWVRRFHGKSGEGELGAARITPSHVIVLTPGGDEQWLRVYDATEQAVRPMVKAGARIMAVSLFMMIIARLIRQR